MPNLIRNTQPDFAAAGGLPELKRHLRINGDYDDYSLSEIGSQAVDYVEEMARCTIFNSTYTYRLDRLCDSFSLPRPPLVSVQSIKYQDEDNAQQTWANTEYDVLLGHEPGIVRLAFDKELPDTRQPAGVIVEYTAGYGAAWSDLPPFVRHTVKLVAHEMYFARDMSPRMERLKPAIDQMSAGDEFGQV